MNALERAKKILDEYEEVPMTDDPETNFYIDEILGCTHLGEEVRSWDEIDFDERDIYHREISSWDGDMVYLEKAHG